MKSLQSTIKWRIRRNLRLALREYGYSNAEIEEHRKLFRKKYTRRPAKAGAGSARYQPTPLVIAPTVDPEPIVADIWRLHADK